MIMAVLKDDQHSSRRTNHTTHPMLYRLCQNCPHYLHYKPTHCQNGKGKRQKTTISTQKTEAEKLATVRKKAAERQKKDHQQYGSVPGFFSVPLDDSAASGSGADANNVNAPAGDAAEIIGTNATTQQRATSPSLHIAFYCFEAQPHVQLSSPKRHVLFISR